MDRLLRFNRPGVILPALLGLLLLGLIVPRYWVVEQTENDAAASDDLHLYPPGPLRLPEEMRPIQYDFLAHSTDSPQPSRLLPAVDSATGDSATGDSAEGDSVRAPRRHPSRLASSYRALSANLPPAAVSSVLRLPPTDTAPVTDTAPRNDVKSDMNHVAGDQVLRLPPTGSVEAPDLVASHSDGDASAASSEIAPMRDVDAAMQAVSQRAGQLTQHAFSLAERGAFYSARAELIQALRIVSQALDAAYGVNLHSQALADGLRAMQEADEFVPTGSRLEADLHLPSIVAAHSTPVLKQTAASATPLMALQSYYTYAQQQLAQAGGHQASASEALFGLGKLYTVLGEKSSEEQKLAGPKAMALHQAALLVDSTNYQAANELGVLLARYGQLHAARRVFLHSLSVSRRAETWHNLAVVHGRLGEHDLAQRAQHEWKLAQSGRTPATGDSANSPVQWIDPATFSRLNPGPRGVPVTPMPVAGATPQEKSPVAWLWPWQKTKR